MSQKFITRYADEAAYDSDFDNLDFPNVSYIDEGDEVRYMESNPYMLTGKTLRGVTEPFKLNINGTARTVTLKDGGKWELNCRNFMPLKSLSRFAESSGAQTFVFPKTWETTMVTSMYQMFTTNTSNLSEVNLNDWDTGNVTNMHEAFYFCGYNSHLSIDLSNWNVGNVTDMGLMFNLSGFSEIGDLSNWNVGNVTTMRFMFQGAARLTYIGDLSNWRTDKVTDMEMMFGICPELNTLGVPPIGDGTKRVGTYEMFYRCPKLTTIPSCGAIHNTVSFSDCPLTIDSAKVVLNALSTPYTGAQTLTFSDTTKGYINADSEALALVAEKQAMGWTIAL